MRAIDIPDWPQISAGKPCRQDSLVTQGVTFSRRLKLV
jgi:hypothetical protein